MHGEVLLFIHPASIFVPKHRYPSVELPEFYNVAVH